MIDHQSETDFKRFEYDLLRAFAVQPYFGTNRAGGIFLPKATLYMQSKTSIFSKITIFFQKKTINIFKK